MNERVSKVNKFDLCGGSGSHVQSALAMVDIMNDRFSKMETGSIPQTPDLTEAESKAYNSALNFLTTFWSNPAPPIQPVLVETRFSKSGSASDVVTKAIAQACEVHQGRPGFFRLKDFAVVIKEMTGGNLSRNMAVSLIATRDDVQLVDASVGIYSYTNYC